MSLDLFKLHTFRLMIIFIILYIFQCSVLRKSQMSSFFIQNPFGNWNGFIMAEAKPPLMYSSYVNFII